MSRRGLTAFTVGRTRPCVALVALVAPWTYSLLDLLRPNESIATGDISDQTSPSGSRIPIVPPSSDASYPRMILIRSGTWVASVAPRRGVFIVGTVTGVLAHRARRRHRLSVAAAWPPSSEAAPRPLRAAPRRLRRRDDQDACPTSWPGPSPPGRVLRCTATRSCPANNSPRDTKTSTDRAPVSLALLDPDSNRSAGHPRPV